MVVFGSKSSSSKTKLFEQPLDKLLSPKSLKQLNEAIQRRHSNCVLTNHNNLHTNLLLGPPSSVFRSSQQRQQNSSQEIHDSDEEERCRQLMLNVLPGPIKCLLTELHSRGPSTVGIFRKSPNAKHCKELRQKLETPDGHASIEQFQVNVIASVFKEWLRSLPDCLLMSKLYPQWMDIAKLIEPLHLDKMRQQQSKRMDASNSSDEINFAMADPQANSNDSRMQMMLSMTPFDLRERHSECVRIVRQLLETLNETNLILLRAIICVLWHISKKSEYNKMCSNNLGVCIGQSLLTEKYHRKKNRRSSSLGLSATMHSSNNLNIPTSSSSSALRHFSSSTFAKRHRRSRSQCLLASTLSLTNLSSSPSNEPMAASTTNLQQQQSNNFSGYLNSSDAQEAAKYVPILVAFMIDNAEYLFGPRIVDMFGPILTPEDCPEVSVKSLKRSDEFSSTPNVIMDGCKDSIESKCSTEQPQANMNGQDVNNESALTTNTDQDLGSSPRTAKHPDLKMGNSKQSGDLSKYHSDYVTRHLALSDAELIKNADLRQHRRNPSMSFITVQVGGDEIAHQDENIRTSTPQKLFEGDTSQQKLQINISPICDLSQTPAKSIGNDTTTSILIVNTPKKPCVESDISGRVTSCSNNCDEVDTGIQSQSSCDSSSASPVGRGHHQRPLSATESTSSSSRASSSTSGVHSESPAFSNESDQVSNRYSLSNSHHQHPIMFNRIPKIPFQYTTSCYGGEAVLYYPSNAHLTHQQRQQQQQQQQQTLSLHRGCTRIQSLDRQSSPAKVHQLNQNIPQRSHVMMLRDYYLSLQEQSQRQQQQAQFIGNHNQQRTSATHQNYPQRTQHQPRYLQRHHSTTSQQLASSANFQQQHPRDVKLHTPGTTLAHYSNLSNELYHRNGGVTSNEIHAFQQQQPQQPANAAIVYQRIRPRLAKIRQNHFNGLYVKRASSPHSIRSSIGTGDDCSGALRVRPLIGEAAAATISKSASVACTGGFMTVSQSSLSQQSSKMSSASDSTEHSADDESDDCSTGEWMESTMV